MFTLSDKIISSRAGTLYHATGQDVVDLVSANFGTNEKTVEDITERDTWVASNDSSAGDAIYVKDASDDASVDSGWAIYRIASKAPIALTKIAAEEDLDIVITVTDLGVNATVNGVQITNSDGTPADIPVATELKAGVMSPLHVALLGLITVTGAVDLDQIAQDSHKKAYSGGTPQDNPIVIDPTTQEVTFNIDALDPLP